VVYPTEKIRSTMVAMIHETGADSPTGAITNTRYPATVTRGAEKASTLKTSDVVRIEPVRSF
jgi:hypothetical protein